MADIVIIAAPFAAGFFLSVVSERYFRGLKFVLKIVREATMDGEGEGGRTKYFIPEE